MQSLNEKIPPKFATVVLDLSVNRAFDYEIPAPLSSKIMLGSKVLVPFRSRRVWGTIVDLPAQAEVSRLRSILEVRETDHFMSGHGLELVEWMARYYHCSVATAFKAVFPLALRKNLSGRFRAANTDPFQGEIYLPSSEPQLTEEQQAAIKKILPGIRQKNFFPVLLFGVTGSGKTEIYLRAIDETLRQGRKAIVIVPEIALTPQTVERFRSRFAEKVAVWHSRLTAPQRRDQWQKIKRGEVSIVIGARSAIFAPASPLGLIVVDEEHEKSYKQGETPRYHARDLAVMRAFLEKTAVLLGSATPSLESFRNVQKKKYHFCRLTRRIDDRPMPPVQVIDMREVLKRDHQGVIFSRELLEAIRARLDRREQTILFLNRRGYANFVLCRTCGFILKCRNCSLSLTYHQSEEKGLCHFCGFNAKVPRFCSSCKTGKLSLLGIGTQKVEKQILKLFPQARVGRLDSDTASRRGHSASVLRAFQDGRLDILIGTQMIAKGLDFPRVTLTGVVLADVTLHVPDFRSGEYTFQLLTQVAGRAGRGDLPGEVIIQTFTPHHPAILAAQNHDFFRFYAQEIRFREELGYPPFTHFIVVTAAGKKEENVRKACSALRKEVEPRLKGIGEVWGPMPAPLTKLSGQYRWQLVLKGKQVLLLNRAMEEPLNRLTKSFQIHFLVDVDPAGML